MSYGLRSVDGWAAKHVHEHFSPNSKLNDPEFVKKLLDWITFWRRNPSRFVQRYFGITLYLYQHIILYLMDIFPSICIVAARSAAKSFIIAVYACKEAILRPGSLIVVASATKKQARLIVSEKSPKRFCQDLRCFNRRLRPSRTTRTISK